MDLLKPTSPNSTPLTPLTFLDRAAAVYGDCLSLIYGDTSYTWHQTCRRCLSLASSIASIGIRSGHVVSVISPNIPAMYELQFAVPMAGAVLNSLNTRLDAHTISLLLAHSESRLLFLDVTFRRLIHHALSLLPASTRHPRLVVIDDDNEALSEYEEMVRSGDGAFEWIRPRSEWDPIVLNYTSGTTSSPKGVVHCHRGIFSVVVGTIIDWAVPNRPVYLWTLPMFHANGWCFPWAIAAVGGTNVCLRHVDPPSIFAAFAHSKVTHMCGAPVILNMLISSDSQRLKTPVKVLTAGSPPPAAILERAEALGFEVTHGYGMTETAGIAILCAWKPQWDNLSLTEKARLKARQGVRMITLMEVQVIDPESGKTMARDGLSQGEIVIRGACVMLGYLKDPEGTLRSMKDGWLYTGDVAVIHGDGYLEIKDRSKDVIISGGENVSSVEVETILYTHAAVKEAAVVSRPDEFWGETPCAFVSVKEDKVRVPTEKEMIEYCRERLPHYMAPKTVVMMRTELPKTSTGKIQKFRLREVAKKMGPAASHTSRL